MSFSQAIGEISQIMQWERQLVTPAAVPSSSTAGLPPMTAGATSVSGSGSTSFSDALSQAQNAGSVAALGMATGTTSTGATLTSASTAPGLLSGGEGQLLSALQSGAGAPALGASSGLLGAVAAGPVSGGTATSLQGVSGVPGVAATSQEDPRVQSMIQAADGLLGKPYVWGGGHGGWGPQPGYDCSGFVSAVLHAGGYLTAPQDTAGLPSASGIAPGPGRYVTIYDRTTAGQVGHVIIEINGQFYESGGEQGSWGGGGGVARISTPSAAYLATFNEVLHPAGL